MQGKQLAEATSGDGAGTSLAMGCRHPPRWCGDEPRLAPYPPWFEPGVDGNIST
jgi:hypothetical protein